MAVTFDAVGPSAAGASSASSTTLSWSHTVGASGTYLLVGATLDTPADGALSMTAKYNGVAMTSLGVVHTNASTAGFLQVWGMANPPTGSALTVLITAAGGTPDGLHGGSLSFTGAGSLSAIQSATGSSTAESLSFSPTVSGNMVAGFCGCGSALTASGSFTSRYITTAAGVDGAGFAAGSTLASTGSAVTPSWTSASDFWAVIAVEVQAGGAAPLPAQAQPGQTWLRRFHHRQALLAAPPAATTPNGAVQPVTTRQPRRYPARAVWRGTVSATTNLYNGTVPPKPVVARRTAARGVWRGYVSTTTNLYNGNQPGGLVRRRASARAVWRGTVSSTTNLYNGNQPGGLVRRRTAARAVVRGGPAPFPPPSGTTPAHLVVARRAAARASWRGYVSSTTNLLAGNQPGAGLVKRRTAARAVWRPTGTRTTNLYNGNQPGGLVRRRTAARAVWAGTTVRTVNTLPSVSGTTPAHLVVARRAAARGVWRGVTARTTNLQYGQQPGGVVRRRQAARAVWAGTIARTVNAAAFGPAGQQPHGFASSRRPAGGLWGGAYTPQPNASGPAGTVQPAVTAPHRPHAAQRVIWRGNPVPGVQPRPATGGLVKRRGGARGLWHGNAGPPPPGAAVSGGRVVTRRPPSRGQWHGTTVRTTNPLPVPVAAPRGRAALPRRTQARGLWRGVAGQARPRILFAVTSARQTWQAGTARQTWQAGTARQPWQAGQSRQTWRAGQVR